MTHTEPPVDKINNNSSAPTASVRSAALGATTAVSACVSFKEKEQAPTSRRLILL